MATGRDDLLWDITCPARPLRVPGVTMAGFRDRGLTPPGLRLVPHPAVALLLVFDGGVTVRDTIGRRRSGSFVTGFGYGDRLDVLRADAFECLQVRLTPMVAYAVLGGAVADLDGTAVTLDDLWGRESARICERLGDLPSWADRFAWVDAWLAHRCARASEAAPEVAWAWRRITDSRGTARVEQVAAELGWSRRQLWARFRAQVGTPPKRAARLVRFDHAVHALVAGRAPAGVAAEGGYADQSHLHRDVAAFSAMTPATVVDEPFLAVDDTAWGRPGPAPKQRAGAGGPAHPPARVGCGRRGAAGAVRSSGLSPGR
ncbi:helix-turn-helix domain-containing protein [Streptomyces sp. NPDC008313]|uniref:helix-turn-helix domain-containing protein n=1 Tax=Streptomyces sp. NPDC008313 TaxID=3364826 RepID=UPI0036E5820D